MGTDNDVGGKPAWRSDAWYEIQATEKKSKLTDVGRRHHEHLVAAAGVDVDTLSPKARMFLAWLAGWHQATVEGAIEVFEAIARVGAQSVIADVARQADHLDRLDEFGGAA